MFEHHGNRLLHNQVGLKRIQAGQFIGLLFIGLGICEVSSQGVSAHLDCVFLDLSWTFIGIELREVKLWGCSD